MKKLFTILAIILCSSQLFGQCIILDLKLNDCVSCRNNITVLQELTRQLPVFAVFNEHQKNDLEDLEYKFTLQDFGLKYLFNNNYYKRFHKKNQTSTWYLLKQNGDIVMEGDLKQIDKADLQDKVDNIVSLLPPIFHCQYDFSREKIFILNVDLDKFQIIDKKNLNQVKNISVRNFDYAYLQSGLKGKDSLAFAEQGLHINSDVKGFRPGIKWIDVNSKGECYALLEYLRPYFINADTITYGQHTCIIQYSATGNVINVVPINVDSFMKYDNYSHRFSLKNDSTFVAVTHPPHDWYDQQLAKNPNKRINYLTEYKIRSRDKVVTPFKYYPIDLPPIHKKKYFENFLSAELCSYPYMGFRYSNELYDLSTLTSCLIVDTATYNNHVDFNNKELGQEGFAVLAVKYMPDNRETLVAYRLKNIVYIKSFKNMVETRHVKVDNILAGVNIEICYIDPFDKQIYFTFNNESNAITLPLSMYGF